MAAYIATCPKCGHENKVTSIYFQLDGGSWIICKKCRNRFYREYTNEDAEFDKDKD